MKSGAPYVEKGSKSKPWKVNTKALSDWLRQRELELKIGEAGSSEELRRRKLAAETQKAEMEMLKAKGELVPLRQLERALANTFAELKTNMRNIPRRTATSIVGETDEIRIKEVLLTEIDQALEVLAQFTLDEPEDDVDD
jgi:phage terminase Nu1 subunit (DNA packaging protein)